MTVGRHYSLGVTMKIPSFFTGKNIVTLFPFADIPSGMKPSAAKSSVLPQHPARLRTAGKCRKCRVYAAFTGWVQMNPLMNPVGSNAEERLIVSTP